MKEQTKSLVTKAENFYNGEAYYGDPVLKILEGINAVKALKKVDQNVHNIAELLAHIIGWEEYVIRQFQGDAEFKMEQNLSFEWQRIDKDKTSYWLSLIKKLEQNHKDLISLLNDNKYDFTKKQTMLNNIMEHDIYHLGQIAILKKMI